jgi:NADPH:quinone reductase-like Zn-dependent oxidoreductase
MTQQKALLLTKKQGEFVIENIDIPTPGSGELLVKIYATALNPVDYKIKDYGIFVEEYPAVLGNDAAGIVEAVGEGVKAFVKGDRV